MRVAPRDAVGEVVVAAGDSVLGHDLIEIARLGAQRSRRQLRQAQRIPAGQYPPYRESGDRAAGQRVEQARDDQAVAVADLVEREQNENGDAGGGQQIAGRAQGEEKYRGGDDQGRLFERGRKEPEQRPADQQAEHGAADALGQPGQRRPVVRLADKDDGQQDRSRNGRRSSTSARSRRAARRSGAYRVAHQRRGERELRAQACAELVPQLRAWVLRRGVGRHALALVLQYPGKLLVDGAQVLASRRSARRARRSRSPSGAGPDLSTWLMAASRSASARADASPRAQLCWLRMACASVRQSPPSKASRRWQRYRTSL